MNNLLFQLFKTNPSLQDFVNNIFGGSRTNIPQISQNINPLIASNQNSYNNLQNQIGGIRGQDLPTSALDPSSYTSYHPSYNPFQSPTRPSFGFGSGFLRQQLGNLLSSNNRRWLLVSSESSQYTQSNYQEPVSQPSGPSNQFSNHSNYQNQPTQPIQISINLSGVSTPTTTNPAQVTTPQTQKPQTSAPSTTTTSSSNQRSTAPRDTSTQTNNNRTAPDPYGRPPIDNPKPPDGWGPIRPRPPQQPGGGGGSGGSGVSAVTPGEISAQINKALGMSSSASGFANQISYQIGLSQNAISELNNLKTRQQELQNAAPEYDYAEAARHQYDPFYKRVDVNIARREEVQKQIATKQYEIEEYKTKAREELQKAQYAQLQAKQELARISALVMGLQLKPDETTDLSTQYKTLEDSKRWAEQQLAQVDAEIQRAIAKLYG